VSIFRISETSHGASDTTVEMARQAEQLGYTDVQTHYHPGQPGTHSVTGTPPAVPDTPKPR
jgi:hypothetical protein